jgi:hypothetical protein
VFADRFIDPVLEEATIDLTTCEQPQITPFLSALHATPPPPPPPPSHLPSPDGLDQWWTPHALQVDGGHAQAFAGQQTLSDAGVTCHCMLTLSVRQWEGTLPSC